MSLAAMPALKLAPAELAARQWSCVFDIGIKIMPPMVVLLAAHFGFLASQSTTSPPCSRSKLIDVTASKVPGLWPQHRYDPTRPQALYIAAAILSVAIVPYTILQMTPTNNQLKAIALSKSSSSGVDDQRVRKLLTDWAWLNYVRAASVASGAVLAALATSLTQH